MSIKTIKRLKPQCLISGLEENNTKTIGIVGAEPSIGVTTISIAMATYLSEICRKKVAVLEQSNKKALQKIACLNKPAQLFAGGFRIGRTDFYFEADSGELYTKGYDYIIIAYAGGNQNYIKECIKCSYKLVLLSLQEWRKEISLKVLSDIYENYDGKRWLYIIQGVDKEVENLSKKMKIKAVKMPYIENSMKVTSISLEFFQKIL